MKSDNLIASSYGKLGTQHTFMLKSSRQHVDAELQISKTHDLLMQSLFNVFANTAGLDNVTLNTEDGSTGAGFGVKCDFKTGALI